MKQYIPITNEDLNKLWAKLMPSQRFCNSEIAEKGHKNLLVGELINIPIKMEDRTDLDFKDMIPAVVGDPKDWQIHPNFQELKAKYIG